MYQGAVSDCTWYSFSTVTRTFVYANLEVMNMEDVHGKVAYLQLCKYCIFL